MPIHRTAALAVAVLFVWTALSGCGSCRKKATPGVPDPGGPPATEGPVGPAAVPTPPPTPAPFERLAARMTVLPASYFGLDRVIHTKIRVETNRLGHTDPDRPNPTEIKGFEVAALDVGDREPNADRWNSELTDLYRALLDTKVFTVAKPVMIVWNAGAGQGSASWTMGVPVARGTEIPSPLLRREVPPLRVHVERGTAREILGKFSGRREENPTIWTFIGKVRRAAGPAVARPAILIFRFLDWDMADLDDNSRMEVLLGEVIETPAAREGPDPALPPDPTPAIP